MAITAEKLTVDVDADTSKAERGLSGFGDKAKGAFTWIDTVKAGLVGLSATAIGAFAGKAIMAASDYNETLSKTGAVFGDATSTVVDNAQRMADQFGTSKTAILDAASGFGLLTDAAGLSDAAGAELSNRFAGLAADATSFYNVPLDEALAAMQSGLTGEAEPMRRFGVLLNEGAVQAKALAMGLVAPAQNTEALNAAQTRAKLAQDAYNKAVRKHGVDSAEAQKAGLALASANDAVAKAAEGTVPPLTEAQKVQARAALITEGMTTATGDLERTQGSFSNRLREVQGRLLNWATDMGTKALPAATALVEGLLKAPAAFRQVVEWVQEHSRAILITAGVLTAVFLPAMVRAGVAAVVSGAQQVGAFVATRVAAIASAAAQWAALARTVAGWVAAGAAAVASGAQTVAIWAMYRAEAIRGAAASVAAHARVVAGWVASGAAAAAGAARTVASWVVAAATSVAQGAVMLASMAVTAAGVVAGWVVMGAQAMLQAARMAAAWFIALGPIGWVTAAVIAIVALIIANWDTVSRVTAQVWSAIVGWVTDAWEALVRGVTNAVNRVRSIIETVFAVIVTIITLYVNAWRTVITAVVGAIVAAVEAFVRGVHNAIDKLASIGAKVAGWFGAARDGIVSAFLAALSFVQGIPGRIVDALSGAGRLMYDSGVKIIQGLADGIRSAIGKVTGAVGDVMQKARDLLPFSPAKEGPFSGKGWAGYSGMSIPRDLAAGIDRNVNLVKRSALGMANAAAIGIPGATVGTAALGRSRTAAPTTPAALGLTGGGGGPSTLVIVDADGQLMGTMRVQAGKVATGQVTPLDEGRARW